MANVNVNTPLIYYYQTLPSLSDVVGPPPTTPLAAPYVDPLSGLTPPNPATLNHNLSLGQPGVWTTTITSGNLAPGIYYFTGSRAGISVQNSTITGSGVLLYFTNGAKLSMGPNSNLDVSPMTSGPYANLLIWQDKSDNATISLQGNADDSNGLPGVLYAPGADINLGGSPNFFAENVLAQSVSCNGTGSYNISYTQQPTLPQVITLTAPSSARKNTNFSVTAVSTGASGNPITLSIDTTSTAACTISGSTVNVTSTGSCVVDANQLGGGLYYAAIEKQQSINVTP
jgi:hypothetical protein